ncbi:MAG TPA: RluA family pseudouridine synthase [Steroidobacteraceae bacterium]|jgi:23S rRNA pseudouridine955/2504/2580 synthase|nr:RluA family pseudouridine synthase [Steroidobacteraceae bacterium]
MPAGAPGETRTEVQHFEVGEEEAGQRLDNYLQRRLGAIPRSRIYRVIRKGEVRVNGRRAGPELRLQLHDRVRIPPVRLAAVAPAAQPSPDLAKRIERSIVHEDENLLVLDKPAGVAVHGGSGVSFGVIEALRSARPGEPLELVHRLDRETSGCLLIARRAAALRELHALMRVNAFEKRYLVLVKDKWDLGAKRIDVPLRTDTRVGGERTVRASPSGKTSVSDFRPVQFFGRTATLMEVTLHTGRTHQIRVHAAHAGHPVAGDEKYGDAAFNEALRALGLKRMFLHAHSLSFSWPRGGEFSINTPLPAELAALIDTLAASGRRRRSAPLRGGESRRHAAPRRAR